MMGELIDRDAAIEMYGDWYTKEMTEGGFVGCLYSLLETLPAVDAVPVVRCKDCKYWALADRYDGLGYGACTYYKTIVRKGVLLSENFFCSYGARMDGGDDDANGT